MLAQFADPLMRVWQGQKQHASRTGDRKNTPGIDYASKITHRQDADFNEIHTDANGKFWLYNHKTNAWDIEGDSDDIPYYRDLNGDLWGFNVKNGAWTVPVTIEYEAPEPMEEDYKTAVYSEGDDIASAIA